MFAFALWDARRSRLLIARDHLGIKPLYYAAREGEWFVCASEVRGLMSSGLVPAAVSQRALAGYLAYGAVQEPLTLFEGVLTLPRGAWKEFDSLGRSTAQGTYWQFPRPDGERQRSLEEVAEEGRALLEQSVRRHLLSDVRVGIFLSSGLDSTAVLGIARRFQSTTDHLNAFTVSFSDDPVYDEAAIARITAARFGVQYHEYPVEESTALAWMRDALAAIDQPSMDGFNTYMVARAVHEQGISVALSGMGGDELFAGYNSFRRVPRLHRAMSWMASMPPRWRAALARNLALSMNSVVRSKAADIATAGPDFLAIYFHTRRLLSDHGLARLGLGSAELDLTPNYQVPELSCDGWVAASDPVASVARLERPFIWRTCCCATATSSAWPTRSRSACRCSTSTWWTGPSAYPATCCCPRALLPSTCCAPCVPASIRRLSWSRASAASCLPSACGCGDRCARPWKRVCVR